MRRVAALGWQRSSNGEAAGSPTDKSVLKCGQPNNMVPSASEGDGAWAFVPWRNGATVEGPETLLIT